MASNYDTTDSGEETELDRDKQESLQRYWLREIGRYDKQFQKWQTAGDKILKLYRQQSEMKTQRKFAMLWANTDVLKPSVYARVPVPLVGRRFNDKDPPGRLASELLERNLSYEIEQADFHETMQLCRDDMLLPGRGSLWVRMEQKPDGYQCLKWDFVHWKDFGHNIARTWPEVNAVWRRVYMTKRELADRFFNGDMNDTVLRTVEMDHGAEAGSSEQKNPAIAAGQSKASVYEIWDRRKRKICFVARGGKVPLEVSTPYLDLKAFWPCPRPLYATLATDSLEPTPDYKYYQDQAEEIDVLTARIASLSDSLKLVGFYPAGENESDIATALSPQVENKMIAVENWAAFAEKGGTAAVVFLPIKDVVDTVTACIQLRTQLIQDVFQIMGLSDIQRGASNPEETLGAQQLKAQYGTNRLKSKRDEISRFAQEALEIGAEIIAENFNPQQVLAAANRTDIAESDPQLVQAAFGLLRDDHLRCFRIDIETDSTIYPDENQEKQARNEFLTAVAQFFQQAAPMVQAVPSSLPLVGELLSFVVRGYRVARELEGSIDQTIAAMMQEIQQQQSQPPPPDPVEERRAMNDSKRLEIDQDKVDKDFQIRQKELQLKVIDGKHKTGMAKEQQVFQQDLAVAQAADQQKLAREQFDRDGAQADRQFERDGAQQQFDNAQVMNGDLVGEDVATPEPGPITQAIMVMAQAIQQMAQSQAETNSLVAAALTAPKKSVVERDPVTGDVIGATQVTIQ